MTIEQYLDGETRPINAAVYLSSDGEITIESRLSPHGNQVLIAGIDVLDGYEPKTLTDVMRFVRDRVHEKV